MSEASVSKLRARLWESGTIKDVDARKRALYDLYFTIRYLREPEYVEAVKSLYPDFLLYRNANGRGSSWLYYLDKLVTARLALATSNEEYERLVDQWWSLARGSDKRARRQSSYKSMSTERSEEITMETLEAVGGEEASLAYIMSGELSMALGENEEKMKRWKSLYDRRVDKERKEWHGGEPYTKDFWRYHLADRIYYGNVPVIYFDHAAYCRSLEKK